MVIEMPEVAGEGRETRSALPGFRTCGRLQRRAPLRFCRAHTLSRPAADEECDRPPPPPRLNIRPHTQQLRVCRRRDAPPMGGGWEPGVCYHITRSRAH
jgi:hypothetical protein